MEIIPYRDLLKRLESVVLWLTANGLDSQADRIRLNKRDVALLSDAFDDGCLTKLFEESSDDRRRELMWSLAESLEFVDSFDALRTQGCRIPPEVISAALDGPADPLSESEKSNRGRNTMFEIGIAGRLARAGLQPRLGAEPDVYVEFKNRRIFIQCKRVFSEAAIPKRIIEAGKQLKRDLARSCDPRDCGLIAVSISRIFNRGDKLLAAPNEDSLRRTLHAEIDSIRRSAKDVYRYVTEPKVAGVYYHLASPAFLEGMGLYIGAHSVTVAMIPGKSDRSLLEDLAGSMATQ